MNIKHLKAGDAVILRRINGYGRYEFRQTTIQTLLAGVVRIGGKNFRRDTGFESGAMLSQAFSKWEAFPANDYEARTQLEQAKEGSLPPAMSERRVRLIRAIERLTKMPFDEVEGDLNAVEGLIGAFGRDEDFRETDDESAVQPVPGPPG